MSKTVTVEVTQEDIDKGEPGDCRRCAVALALGRVAGLVRVYLKGSAARASFYECRRTVTLPAPAYRFIRSFDKRQPCEPTFFTLELPDEQA